MVTSRKAQIGWRKRPCESGKSGFDSHRVHQIPTIKGHEPVFHKHLGESSILSVGTKRYQLVCSGLVVAGMVLHYAPNSVSVLVQGRQNKWLNRVAFHFPL